MKVFAHPANRTFRVRPTSENPTAGEVLIGTVDHDPEDDDSVGWGPGHVLWHHIQDLAIKADLWGYAGYKILLHKPITSVWTKGNTLSVAVGSTKQIEAGFLPPDATNGPLTYTSATPATATVTSQGAVTGVAAGTVNVTVAGGGQSKVVAVTVTA